MKNIQDLSDKQSEKVPINTISRHDPVKESEYFDPKTNKFPYPVETDRHYLVVKKNDGTIFDENYPYIDKSRAFRFKQFLTRVALYAFVFPLMRIRLGLKIKGRENLRKHRDVIKKGVVSCANHVHMWDYIAVMCAVRPHRTNILAWGPNISGENGKMIRSVGGIPIPEGSIRATSAYIKAAKELINGGGWLHIYAEGAMWEYYAPIRPFKRGVAYFSRLCEKPIIPLGFSYREPGWIRKRIFGQIAKFTLTVGEPIFPDLTLGKKEAEDDLTRRAHAAVCRLSGIEPTENLYPPVFDNSRRVDYYTETYGVGYKGSH